MDRCFWPNFEDNQLLKFGARLRVSLIKNKVFLFRSKAKPRHGVSFLAVTILLCICLTTSFYQPNNLAFNFSFRKTLNT